MPDERATSPYPREPLDAYVRYASYVMPARSVVRAKNRRNSRGRFPRTATQLMASSPDVCGNRNERPEDREDDEHRQPEDEPDDHELPFPGVMLGTPIHERDSEEQEERKNRGGEEPLDAKRVFDREEPQEGPRGVGDLDSLGRLRGQGGGGTHRGGAHHG